MPILVRTQEPTTWVTGLLGSRDNPGCANRKRALRDVTSSTDAQRLSQKSLPARLLMETQREIHQLGPHSADPPRPARPPLACAGSKTLIFSASQPEIPHVEELKESTGKKRLFSLTCKPGVPFAVALEAALDSHSMVYRSWSC